MDSPRDVATYDEKPEMCAREARRRVRRGLAARRLRLRRHQLREPGHGRPHRRRSPRPCSAIETVDGCLGRVLEAVHAQGRRLHRHRRPRQRGPHARAGRQPEHRPLDEPGAARGHGRRGRAARRRRRSRTWRRRCSSCSGSEQPAAMTGRSPAPVVCAAFTIDARDGSARAGVLRTAHGDVRTPAFVPLASTATVKTLQSSEVAGLGYDMVLGNTFHLFIQPGHELIARAGRPPRVHGLGPGRSSPTRAATRSSRWATGRWPRRSSAGAASASRRIVVDRGGGGALPLLPRRRGALHGPGDLDGDPGRARLGHRAGLRRVHAVPRGPRVHGALDGAHAPLARPLHRRGTARTRPPASSCSASSRAASTRTCAPSPRAYVDRPAVDGIAIGGSLGAAKEQMREVVEWSLRGLRDERPRHLLGIGDVDDLVHAVGAGIDLFDCATPTRLARHGTALVQDPDAPLAARPRQERAPRRAASRSPTDCACPACREHTRAYLHYLLRAGEPTARAAAHPPQPHLHGAADARAAGGDRGRPLRRPSAASLSCRVLADEVAQRRRSGCCTSPSFHRLDLVLARREQHQRHRADRREDRRAARGTCRAGGGRPAARRSRSPSRARAGWTAAGAIVRGGAAGSARVARGSPAWPRSPRLHGARVASVSASASRRVTSVTRRGSPASSACAS